MKLLSYDPWIYLIRKGPHATPATQSLNKYALRLLFHLAQFSVLGYTSQKQPVAFFFYTPYKAGRQMMNSIRE
jgi:hypothetical protein